MSHFITFLIYYALFISVCAVLYRLRVEGRMEPSYSRRILVDLLWESMLIVPLCKIVDMGYFHFEASLPVWRIILGIYLAGVAIGLLLLGLNLMRLRKIKKEAVPYEVDGTRVWLHRRATLGAFSWYRYIFIPENAITRTPDELRMILAHEHAHVYLFHWLDLAVANLFLVFQWFNPTMWYLKSELQRVHECEADGKVISDKEIPQIRYEKFLIHEAAGKQLSGLIHNLSFSSLKYRLTMMNRKDLRKNAIDSYSFIVAIATLLLILL